MDMFLNNTDCQRLSWGHINIPTLITAVFDLLCGLTPQSQFHDCKMNLSVALTLTLPIGLF